MFLRFIKVEMQFLKLIGFLHKKYDILVSNSIETVRKAKPLLQNRGFLDRDDIINILTNASSLRDKALFLCGASSGMGKGELINLKVGDIKLDESGIGIVSIRREKTQVDFTTFISPEAMLALRNYYDERERDSTPKKLKEKDYVFVTYSSSTTKAGLPLSDNAVLKIFNGISHTLGYTEDAEKGKYSKCRSHGMRKFFSSTLQNAGLPQEKVNYLLGHQMSGTNQAYLQTDVDKMKELYISYLHHLTFERTIEIKTLSGDDAKVLHDANEELQSKVKELEAEAAETKELLKELKRVTGIDTSKTSATKELKQVWVIPEEPKE